MKVDRESRKAVYFAGAIRGDRAMLETFREIIHFLKAEGFTVLTEHIIEEHPDANVSPEDVEKRDMAWLDSILYFIAEVSGASTGVGREIEYARMKGLLGKTPAKILCLYRIERESGVSKMVRGMSNERYPNVFVKPYRDIEDAKEIISKFLAESS